MWWYTREDTTVNNIMTCILALNWYVLGKIVLDMFFNQNGPLKGIFFNRKKSIKEDLFLTKQLSWKVFLHNCTLEAKSGVYTFSNYWSSIFLRVWFCDVFPIGRICAIFIWQCHSPAFRILCMMYMYNAWLPLQDDWLCLIVV